MKLVAKIALFSLFAVVLFSTAPGATYNITLDENGNATLNGNPLHSFVAADPSGGVSTSPVLFYILPYDVQGGDVALLEPAQPNAPLSDIIRFYQPTPGAPSSFLIFYSDFEAGEHRDLADVGFPALSSPSVFVPEVGPEGNNGGVYSPALPQPGTPLLGGPVTATVTYTILSDLTVPDRVSTAMVLALAAIVLVAIRSISKLTPRRT